MFQDFQVQKRHRRRSNFRRTGYTNVLRTNDHDFCRCRVAYRSDDE